MPNKMQTRAESTDSLPAGYLETIEPPEMLGPGFPSYAKEKAETEAEGNGATRNYGVGVEYSIDYEGTSVIKILMEQLTQSEETYIIQEKR